MSEMIKQKVSKFPHVYTLSFLLIIVFAILTWILPSGSFERELVETNVGERNVVIPGSYQRVDKISEDGDLRQGIMAVLMAPTRGVQNAADVVAFVILIGGTFALINKTGAIAAGMKKVIAKLKHRSVLLIPIVMVLFALGGTSFGMAEETLPFYAILLPIIMGMGYDSMTAFLLIFLSATLGYSASTTNPFSVLIAQGLAGIEGNPQLIFRYIQWAIYTAMGIGFVVFYANKVKKNPKSSIMYEDDLALRTELGETNGQEEHNEFTNKHKLVLLVFAIGMIIMVYGLLTYGWYMDEISMVFLGTGLAVALVYGMREQEIATTFVDGMKDFVYAGIIIGVMRGILVVAEDGMIMDTILNTLVNALQGVPTYIYTTLCSIFYSVLSIMLPSSSGMAALTVPIFGPLTEILGINKEALITAYQYGNNNISLLSPTNVILVAGLGICRIPIERYWKVVWKFMIPVFVVGWIFAGISALLPY